MMNTISASAVLFVFNVEVNFTGSIIWACTMNAMMSIETAESILFIVIVLSWDYFLVV